MGYNMWRPSIAIQSQMSQCYQQLVLNRRLAVMRLVEENFMIPYLVAHKSKTGVIHTSPENAENQ